MLGLCVSVSHPIWTLGSQEMDSDKSSGTGVVGRTRISFEKSDLGNAVKMTWVPSSYTPYFMPGAPPPWKESYLRH